MAPKQKITKEIILEAAFQITREKGFENVNTRNLAKQLGCSTQPIYSQYSNMDELKKEFHRYAATHFDEYALESLRCDDYFKKLGRLYINFAKNESNLFKLLFMSELLGLKSFSDMYTDEDNLEVAKMLSEDLDLSLEIAKNLYMKVWIFNHGVASMIATNTIILADGEAEAMIDDACDAFITQALNK